MGSKWSKGTVYLSVAMITLGFLLIVLGWNGAAGKDTIQQQFPYLLSGGLLGLGLVASGLALAVIQEIRRAAATVTSELASMEEYLASATPAGPTAVPIGAGFVVAGRTAYHRPDCHLVEGRHDVQPMAIDDAQARGLSPCRICEPQADAS